MAGRPKHYEMPDTIWAVPDNSGRGTWYDADVSGVGQESECPAYVRRDRLESAAIYRTDYHSATADGRTITVHARQIGKRHALSNEDLGQGEVDRQDALNAKLTRMAHALWRYEAEAMGLTEEIERRDRHAFSRLAPHAKITWLRRARVALTAATTE